MMKNGLIHIKIAEIDFNCPYCKKVYNDADDKYLIRCENNKNYTTKIKCNCGNYFYMTYNYMGNAVSYKPEL